MKKRIFIISVSVVLVLIAVTLTACGNEAEALQERITTLEGENTELQSTITSLRTELQTTQTNLSNTQNDLHNALSVLAAIEDEASQQGAQSGALAITYGGEPNPDMSWPLSHGDLVLGLRVNLNDLDEDVEIVWSTTNEDIYTVAPSEDGTSATVTPVTTGSAQLVVKVGEQETRSWVRIT